MGKNKKYFKNFSAKFFFICFYWAPRVLRRACAYPKSCSRGLKFCFQTYIIMKQHNLEFLGDTLKVGNYGTP